MYPGNGWMVPQEEEEEEEKEEEEEEKEEEEEFETNLKISKSIFTIDIIPTSLTIYSLIILLR